MKFYSCSEIKRCYKFKLDSKNDFEVKLSWALHIIYEKHMNIALLTHYTYKTTKYY